MCENKKKITLNLHMYIFIIIATIAVINDNIIYFTALNYEISLIISTILIAIINIILLKKELLEIKSNFNKMDLVGLIPYCIIYFITILHIDDFVDAISYHLYNQRNPFIDRINFDLLPSSSFFFPLGDRINYIFVRFLGYRFGNILSLYLVIIMFYQIKNFLSIIIPQMKEKLKIIIASIMIYTFSVNLCAGEYSIDTFSAVILLELLYIAIQNINILKNKNYLYLTVFLSGIAIGIKISNVLFVIPIEIYMIIKSLKEYKNIKFYDLLFVIILFFAPFGVYMLNAYIQTQNPVFPFYNNIFKSKYYEMVSSKDLRLGPKNFAETVIWPVLIWMNPLRGDDIRYLVDPVWAVGYIVLIYCLFQNKDNKNAANLINLSFIVTIIWVIFVCGYVRYGMFIAIAYFLIEIYLLNQIIHELVVNKESYNVFKLILDFIFIITISVQMLFSLIYGIIYISENVMISLNDIAYTIDEATISGTYDIDGVWIGSRYNIACIDLIRSKEDPIYNADIIVSIDPMNVKSNYSDYTKEMFYQKIKRKKIVYSYK